MRTQSHLETNVRDSRSILWDVLYAVDIGLVSLAAYWAAFFALASLSPKTSNTIGALWAVISALFVFRERQTESFQTAVSRLFATAVGAALCLIYLLFFPPSVAGMAILIAVGTLALLLSDRHGEITTVAITTAVIMIVALMEPKEAWHQPLLRLADSIIGIVIGVAAKWLESALFDRFRNS